MFTYTVQNDLPLSKVEYCSVIFPKTEDERPSKRSCTEYRRIPCRARSLSNFHNTDTAYFEIPRDAPHGLQLHCSHEECIQSGRRFRYCQVCQLPVAKRNFVKRHGHGMITNSRELRETIDRVIPCDFPLPTSANLGVCEGLQSNPITLTQPSDQLSCVSVSESEEDADDVNVISTLTHAYTSAILPQSQSHLSQEDYPSIRPMIPSTISYNDNTSNSVSALSYSSLCESKNESVSDPLKESADFLMPHLVPESPSQRSCILDATCIDEFFDLPQTSIKMVPLVEPGARITEDEFAEAIMGIDFSRIFD